MSRETECKNDEDFGTVWGKWGKTAKMKAAEQCTKWGYYNTKIHDCGGWKFKAVCSGENPKDWSLPYSDESAKSLGFGNRNEAAAADCKSKGYDTANGGEWRDKGEWQFSLKCAKVRWDNPVSGKDANGSNITIQKCNDWIGNDVNTCNSSSKPKDTKKWIACGIGSSPGGISPWDKATACSPATKDFSCKWGQNCFAITNHDVVWDPPVSGCDGAGSNLTIQKCNGWIDNDVNSCNNSPTKPKDTKKWIACGIGSSPGGIAPGDGARACSPISDSFSCAWGQNCFAITNQEETSDCENHIFSNPGGAIDDFASTYKWQIIISVVVSIIVLSMVAVIVVSVKSK